MYCISNIIYTSALLHTSTPSGFLTLRPGSDRRRVPRPERARAQEGGPQGSEGRWSFPVPGPQVPEEDEVRESDYVCSKSKL